LTKEFPWFYQTKTTIKPNNRKIHNFLLICLFGFFSNIALAIQFDEGIDYIVIENEKNAPQNKTSEVIEFFGYFCPHCKSFAPSLKKWEKSLPKNVNFTQLHVPFREINHQRLFFALKNIKAEEKLHYKIFKVIQDEGRPLNNFLEIASWVESQGVDEKEFEESWNSAVVRNKMNSATKLMKLYKIDGVPQLIINRTYLTSPGMVGGSHKRTLKLVEYLLNKK
jgi:thiol:disulfide interchange protein DsbA